MKPFDFVLHACMIVMCVSSAACSSDDDKQNAPPPPDVETAGLITSIADSDVTSYFNYENGMMTHGNDGYYGSFVIQRNPFLITSSYTDKYESVYLEFKEIQTNEKGFITAAAFTVKETGSDFETDNAGRLTAEYDKNGCLTKLEQTATDRERNMTCTWANGNLVRLEYKWEDRTQQGKIDDAGNETYALTYPKDVPVNSGIYILADPILDFGFPAYLWYAGLLGKPTKNLPTIIKYDYRGWNDFGTSVTGTETRNYPANYDREGRIEILYMDNLPFLAVAYDGAAAVLPKN